MLFNPFVPNALFLYHMKIFQGIEKRFIENKCVNKKSAV